jgi:hypothetical protein
MNRKLLALFGSSVLILVSQCYVSAQDKVPQEWEQNGYLERGNYLVNHLAECVGCHTPLQPGSDTADKNLFLSGVPEKFAGRTEGPPQIAGYPGPNGARFYPKNLTPDDETGLGKWSESDFVKALKEGVRPDGSKYQPSAMPWELFRNMKEEDGGAIYRYLRTIKPIRNQVPANIAPKK